MKVVSRWVTSAKRYAHALVDGIHRSTFNSDPTIRHNVHRSLAKVSRRLNIMLDYDALALQQDHCDATRRKAKHSQKLSVDTLKAIDKSFSSTVSRYKRCGPARPGQFCVHSAIR